MTMIMIMTIANNGIKWYGTDNGTEYNGIERNSVEGNKIE